MFQHGEEESRETVAVKVEKIMHLNVPLQVSYTKENVCT